MPITSSSPRAGCPPGGLLSEVLALASAGYHADVPRILHWVSRHDMNFNVITLTPKVVGVTDMQHFRPTTVINVLEQIFAKVHVARLAPIVDCLANCLTRWF